MQTGGRDLIWFGHTDQLEIYLQLNARIYRQGQTGQVRFHHVVARGTVDEAVFTRLMDKTADQDAMMKALQAYREGKGL
jgi:SNF2 family DNA or RNA helicase